MYVGIIIITVIILLILYFPTEKQLTKDESQQNLAIIAPIAGPDVNSEIKVIAIEEDYQWWHNLDNNRQLQLALMLAEKVLPVWETYASTNELTYQESIAKPVIKIEPYLLQAAIESINMGSRQDLPGAENRAIKKCYAAFIGPVVALQDGTWFPPYPAKKAFLAVYNIVKCVVEPNESTDASHCLVTSITLSLDCMDMNKLYSKEEIRQLLNEYRSLR
ncbi:MAG: hypothetical protein ABJB11_12120 [Ferruginibacter sp.]